jgi:DNA-binding NtrC family response regulator
MTFVLAGTVGGVPVRIALRDGLNVLGSAPEADVQLRHGTVSRTHAELRVEGGRVEVKDLGSRNGTFVADGRVTVADVPIGTPVTFGQVRLRLEQVEAADLEPAAPLSPSADGAPARPEAERAERGGTIRTKPIETFATERLPALLDLLLQGADAMRLAQATGAAAFETLPVVEVEVASSGPDRAVVFFARREGDYPEATRVEAKGELSLRVTFPEPATADAFRSIVSSAGALIRLAVPSRRAEPGRPAAPPPLPDPPSVVDAVRAIYEEAARVAAGDIGVLICGESGTGKEVLARYIHAASGRRGGPFVDLNCAALPRDLLEAELFGIEKGVATGVEARPGKFEMASGGTLFLDEIGDMALETQARILRALQEGVVYRIGGNRARAADIRVVAATNRDLDRMRAERQFREDLYYRIAIWTPHLPPLRFRKGDIPNLAAHFLAREAARRGLRVRGLSRAALDALVAYDWPGNVRQLEKEMARSVLFLGDGEMLDTARLSDPVRRAGRAAPASETGGLAAVLERAEREEILKAVRAAQGDVARAAEALGVGRSTLYRRMKALGLDAPSEDASGAPHD